MSDSDVIPGPSPVVIEAVDPSITALKSPVVMPTGTKLRLLYSVEVTATLLDQDGNPVRSPYSVREDPSEWTADDAKAWQAVQSVLLGKAQAQVPDQFPA